MPVIDVSDANEERVEAKRVDPLLVRLTKKGQAFRFKSEINSLGFIALYRAKLIEWGVNDDRAIAETLHDLVVDDDKEGFIAAVSDIADPVDTLTFKDAAEAVFQFYLRGNPTQESSTSSDTPSPTGSNSTERSSKRGPVYG